MGEPTKDLTNNDFSYPRPSEASEAHSNTSSSFIKKDHEYIKKRINKFEMTYCESEIWNPIQYSSAYDQNASKKWEVEIDPDHVQPLLVEKKRKRKEFLVLCILWRLMSFIPLRHWWHHKFQWQMQLYTSLPEREKPRTGYQLPLHDIKYVSHFWM